MSLDWRRIKNGIQEPLMSPAAPMVSDVPAKMISLHIEN